MIEFQDFSEMDECACDDCTARDWSLGFEACPREVNHGGLPIPLPRNGNECLYYECVVCEQRAEGVWR